MSSGKFWWITLVQFAFIKGWTCTNSTKAVSLEQFYNTTNLLISNTTVATLMVNSTNFYHTYNKTDAHVNANDTVKSAELVKLFQENTNITDLLNITSTQNNNAVNIVPSLNDTFETNYTSVAEAVEFAENQSSFRLPNSAAIAAGVFLISAVVGYAGCVGYRRFLQRKYGNSQILVGEEVYDTSDLRNFEI